MSFKTSQITLASALVTGGTVAFGYPSGTNKGSFESLGHKLKPQGFAELLTPAGFTLSFGDTEITLTYLGATTIPAGTDLYLQLDEAGCDNKGIYGDCNLDTDITKRSSESKLIEINLNIPAVADPDGVLDGVLATDSEQTYVVGDFESTYDAVNGFDVPRNVTVVGSASFDQVVTVTGEDEYGEVMVESLTGNGATPVVGKKAFQKITSVVVAVGTAAQTVDLGWGTTLGLPQYLEEAGNVISEKEDGSTATAGTLAVGIITASTATTGDVRGTYIPNSAPDGSKQFKLLVATAKPNYKGVDQFAG